MKYKKILTAFTIFSIIGSTSFTLANELTGKKPLHRFQFSEVDSNRDNLISRKEMIAHTQTRFQDVDINGDGALSLDELIVHNTKKVSDRANKMIKKMDKDSNGLIDFDELKSATMDRFRNIFNKLDMDNDSYLNKKEFSKLKNRNG